MPEAADALEDLLDSLEGLGLDAHKAEIRESRFESARRPTLDFRISNLCYQDGLDRVRADVNAEANGLAALLDIQRGVRDTGWL
jgi:hypothetical protein